MIDGQTFTLLTGLESKPMLLAVDLPQWVENDLGVSARSDALCLLIVNGRPSNRIQEGTTVERRIGVMWPDVVHLRNQLNEMIDQAVEKGVMTVPEEQRR